ncbi:hypothetical protein HK102_010923, partial [Quaeritorhiza haematococci]
MVSVKIVDSSLSKYVYWLERGQESKGIDARLSELFADPIDSFILPSSLPSLAALSLDSIFTQDFTSTLAFTTRLLRRLHKYLTRAEQVQLLETIQGVVSKVRGKANAIEAVWAGLGPSARALLPAPSTSTSGVEGSNTVEQTATSPHKKRGKRKSVAGLGGVGADVSGFGFVSAVSPISNGFGGGVDLSSSLDMSMSFGGAAGGMIGFSGPAAAPPPAPVLVRNVLGGGSGFTGIPVLRRLEAVRQPPRSIPHIHSRSELGPSSKNAPGAGSTKGDPFIVGVGGSYKTGKKDQQVIFVANETAFFDVTLANPFMFDLDVQRIVLWTSGVPFKPFATSTLIPADSRTHTIRLSGLPLQSGTLNVHGVSVRLFGGVVMEDIQPMSAAAAASSKSGGGGGAAK